MELLSELDKESYRNIIHDPIFENMSHIVDVIQLLLELWKEH